MNKRQRKNDLAQQKDSTCPYCGKQISKQRLLEFGACKSCFSLDWRLSIDLKNW